MHSPASGSSPDVPARKMSRSNSGKIPRGRMACLQCRSRRSKCSGRRPEPCQRCIEEGLTCTWPAMDGRSARAKKKANGSESSRAVNAPFRAPGRPSSSSDLDLAVSRPGGDGTMATTNWQMNTFNDSRISDSSALRLEADPFAGLQVTPASESALPSFPSDMFDGSWANFPDSFFPNAGESSSTGVGLQQSLMDPQLYPAGMPSTVDPQQLVWAFSSRLPFVEESSQGDSTSPNKGPAKSGRPQDGQIFKITWWRPHGKTAIAPGLKRITLKVRIDRNATPLHAFSPASDPFSVTPDLHELFLPDGMPIHPIMRHLLELFSVHFSSQFPYLQASSLKEQLDNGTGSVFLFNCIASAAARFSTHPSIALPNVEPHAYGNVFWNRSKALLGSMLGVPCRDTVAGFLLLALTGAGNDSESEVWMMIGIAVRMSIDIGLHVDCATSAISDEERRLNRLLFWSVLMLDHALSFGVGRPTSVPQQTITQTLPTDEDLKYSDSTAPRSAFVSAARMFLLFTPLINMMNEPDGSDSSARQQAIVSAIINEYSQLPEDMVWNVKNLQMHDRVHQAPIFLWLHLWTHTVLVSQSLIEPNKIEPESSLPSATPTRASTASAVWSNSARTIGEILVLSDIVNPFAYIPLELANQCFYVAACYYVREIELLGASDGPADSGSKKRPWSHEPLANASQISLERSRQSDLSRALLVSVAKESVLTLQQGLDKQTRYWSSIQWIAQSLAQRLEGIARHDLDLADITAKMKTCVSLPDAGLVDREAHKSSA